MDISKKKVHLRNGAMVSFQNELGRFNRGLEHTGIELHLGSDIVGLGSVGINRARAYEDLLSRFDVFL